MHGRTKQRTSPLRVDDGTESSKSATLLQNRNYEKKMTHRRNGEQTSLAR